MNILSLNQPPTSEDPHPDEEKPPPHGRLSAFLDRYGDVFWWLHSLWALLIGIVVMWVGARHYGLLRVAVFQIAFIWLASLAAPALVNRAARSPWAHRLRLAINYFSKNFYQQLLFFLLPIYFASASAWSANLLFVGFLAVSALLSTLDVVYDRHLSVRRGLTAVFFAFNLFACINVMLPVVWRISNLSAMRISGALALVAFVTILFGRRRVRWRTASVVVALSAIVLLLTVEFARALIPPAPLRLVTSTFSFDVDRRARAAVRPVERLDPGWTGRLFALTAVSAPMGLEDLVAHRWYANGRLVCSSPFYRLVGGRQEGFRLWTSCALTTVAGGWLRVDVETEGGQLIGRTEIPVEPPAVPTGDTRLPLPF